jgi:hypothetical protein
LPSNGECHRPADACSASGAARYKTRFDRPPIPEPAFDFAAAVVTGIAAALAEAGASATLLREDFLPKMSGDAFANWCVRLAGTADAVRCCQALPVLILASRNGVIVNRKAIQRAPWDCVVCPIIDGKTRATLLYELGPSRFGVALSPDTYATGARGAAEFDAWLEDIISEVHPAVITTAGDLPAALDIGRLNELWENIQSQ